MTITYCKIFCKLFLFLKIKNNNISNEIALQSQPFLS